MCRNPDLKTVLGAGMLALLLTLGTPAGAESSLSPVPITQPETGAVAPVKVAAEPAAPESEPTELTPAKDAKTASKPVAKTVTKTHKAHTLETTQTTPLETSDGVALETGHLSVPPSVPGIEHVRFERRPVVVLIELGRERLVHFPFEVAIHKPDQTDGPLDVEIIGTTAYLNALAPMANLRLVAEGLEGQGMIPMDVVVRDQSPDILNELEIQLASFAKPTSEHGAKGANGGSAGRGDEDDDEPAPPDVVQLSRYCAQMLYAPQRLIKPLPGVRQVDVRALPVANLYRGGAVTTTPIGAWRAGALYVTAVRLSNRTSQAIELDMEQLRGHWIAATPQHWRLLPQGSEADTTALCLISEQAFDAARP